MYEQQLSAYLSDVVLNMAERFQPCRILAESFKYCLEDLMPAEHS